jgi:predicted ABC-type ATPase
MKPLAMPLEISTNLRLSMIQPLLVIVAGPNGSGKSTLIRQLRSSPNIDSPNLYINADDLKAQLELTDAAAQSLAQQLRKNAIEQRESLIFETVASHPSKISELQQAVLAGYRCHVILIATDNPAINVDRVAHRVRNGGHDVPENRIRDRYQRTLALFPSMIEQASEALIFDNTSSNAVDHTLQAVLVRDGHIPNPSIGTDPKSLHPKISGQWTYPQNLSRRFPPSTQPVARSATNGDNYLGRRRGRSFRQKRD